MIFFWPHVSLFSPLQYRVRNSEKNWFFEKNTWKGFEIVKWSAVESKKFNAKYVNSTPKFNAKLCKIGDQCVEFT